MLVGVVLEEAESKRLVAQVVKGEEEGEQGSLQGEVVLPLLEVQLAGPILVQVAQYLLLLNRAIHVQPLLEQFPLQPGGFLLGYVANSSDSNSLANRFSSLSYVDSWSFSSPLSPNAV